MKHAMKTQTMLKLGLLAALAANVSYQPVKEMIEVTNLAQVAETAPPTSGAQQATAPAVDVSYKSPVTKRGAEVGDRGYIEVCEGRQKHRVIFREYEMGDKKYTAGIAQKAEIADESLAVTIGEHDGDYTLVKREAILKSLTAELKKRHGCTDETASSPVTRSGSTRPVQDEEELRRTREELAREAREQEIKVRRCEMKKVRDGRDFEYVALDTDDNEHLKCQIKRLSMLETERDEDGKLLSKSAIIATAEKIVNDKLKRQIKAMLLSKDESENDTGKELADDAMEALGEVSRSDRRITKLVNMFQGYIAGGETARRSRERENDSEEIKERLREARLDLRHNPGDRGALWNLQRALGDHYTLAGEIDNDIFYGPVAALQFHRNNGHLNSGDYRDFLAPYDSLKREMENMLRQDQFGGVSGITGRTLGDLAVPPDLLTWRSSNGLSRAGTAGTSYPLTMPNVRSQFGTSAIGLGTSMNSFGTSAVGPGMSMNGFGTSMNGVNSSGLSPIFHQNRPSSFHRYP